jgi:hypothetical protein
MFGCGVLEDGFDNDVGACHAITGNVGCHASHELGRLPASLRRFANASCAHQRRL